MRGASERINIRMYGLGSAMISATAVVILSSSCYPETETTPCEGSNLRCPPGYACSADQKTCIQGGCGDNIVGPGEECDDGNITNGDGCDSNCTKTRCDNGIVTSGEECDDDNDLDDDGCDGNCTKTRCGNGIVLMTQREECDDGLMNSDSGVCLVNCQRAICGDGYQRTEGNNPEKCDDGNESNDDFCLTTCQSARCGDGYVRETEKPGQPHEVCDDGNNLDCGTCKAGCDAFRERSTGFIVTGEANQFRMPPDTDLDPMHYDWFQLNDGMFIKRFTYTFTGITPPAPPEVVTISLANGMSKTEIAERTMNVINASNLRITATRYIDHVKVTHNQPSSMFDHSIAKNTSDALSVSGMEGGEGQTCGSGEGCRSDADCVSYRCLSNMCQ